MSFRDLVEGLHGKDACIRGGVLAGIDGLLVEGWQTSPQTIDLTAVCAEMAQMFRESGRITAETGLGNATEVSVESDQGTIMVRRVTDEYILLLVVDPGAVAGKSRFHLRQGARRAKELL